MIIRNRPAAAAAVLMAACAAAAQADPQEYRFRVVAAGLSKPTGIAIEGSETIYFTQAPAPGQAGMGNSAAKMDLEDGQITILHMGEPQPVNITIGRDGAVYWTCLSAGVILKQTEDGTTTPFLTGLLRPSGISVSKSGLVYFTEIPTPGAGGGANRVSFSNGSQTTLLHSGEPEPVDIVVTSEGDAYWTCRSAGVILWRSRLDGMTRVLVSGLDHPTGIAVDHKSRHLFFTEVPTPGVAGSNGGRNKVSRLDLSDKSISLVHQGDPEPTDVAVARNGSVYWTCTSAGVIVEAKPKSRD